MANVGTEPIQVRAVSRYARVAPDKARQVVRHIRGRGIEDARRVLELSPKAVSEQILKTLDSAVANAEHNNGLDADDLIVSQAIVDEGPTLRRFQPRAMGRAYRIRKRTSHITVLVGPKPATPGAAPTRQAARSQPRTTEPATSSAEEAAARPTEEPGTGTATEPGTGTTTEPGTGPGREE